MYASLNIKVVYQRIFIKWNFIRPVVKRDVRMLTCFDLYEYIKGK